MDDAIPPTTFTELDLGAQTLLIEQVADLHSLAVQSVVAHEAGPYWAYLWPSARALARFAAELDDLAGLRVLDLGCGVGAIGVAAATRGAHVVAADLRREAIVLAQRNAAKNGVELKTLLLDWNDPPPDLGKFDRIFAADVFYEDGMLSSVLRFSKKHLAPDGAAFIADPMRVMPSGVAGAARFHAIESTSLVLIEGQTMTGGVTLYELRPRRPRGEAPKK
jgi:predicted nicotinamide N-methyase